VIVGENLKKKKRREFVALGFVPLTVRLSCLSKIAHTTRRNKQQQQQQQQFQPHTPSLA
jgi:hypothetical protein